MVLEVHNVPALLSLLGVLHQAGVTDLAAVGEGPVEEGGQEAGKGSDVLVETAVGVGAGILRVLLCQSAETLSGLVASVVLVQD